jgi:hypothetical protein
VGEARQHSLIPHNRPVPLPLFTRERPRE